MTAQRRGLSLIECLVVVAIIAILIGLMLPAVRRVREPAARMKCMNNLRQLMLGVHNYESQHGRLPPGCVGPSSADPGERLSWMVLILPYVEQEAVFQKFDPEAGYAGNVAGKEPIKLFRCPSALSAETEPVTLYYACGGVGADSPGLPVGRPGVGLFGYDRQLNLLGNVKDGTSNTIALLETHDQPGPWAQGGFATLRGLEPTMARTGQHKGGLMVAMADGSVRFLDEDVPFAKLAAYATVAGGEPVDSSVFD